jgi:hypothetical protein
MRKPSEEDLSDDVADTGSVGDGFSAAVDLSDSPYGEGFDGDYSTEEDDSSGSDSTDDSFGDDGDGDLDETSFGSDLTEDEAEDILEDMFDETYGPDADEVVDDLQESTGMSAIEILEDITGTELSGSDASAGLAPLDSVDGLDTIDPFEGPDMPEADMATKDDFDLNADGHVNHADVHELTHPFDFHDG